MKSSTTLSMGREAQLKGEVGGTATRKKPTAVDLFSGCGGLTRGLKDAGFKVVGAVEIDPRAELTYSMNHKDVRLFAQDIREIDAREMLRSLRMKVGELDLLAGCPPCQGFSRLRTMNKGSSVLDQRNDLVSDFLRFVTEMLPKCVMMENVPALAGDRRFDFLLRRLRSLGYDYKVDVLDAADFGVPQRRKRLIMLASRVHRPDLASKSRIRRTVRSALEALESPSVSGDALHALPERRSKSVMKMISLIPHDGGSRKHLPKKYHLDCHKRFDGFGDVYGRMKWDDVSPTITSGCSNPSKGRFLHPSQDRNITLREAAILQGFPNSYKFDVSHGKEAIALMIGNALPPPFIAAHAKNLLEAVTSANGH